ncbi:MAG: LPS export ABC transporter periplasmic protein LptC [Rubrivivax sp.]|nr:MAG: LPS export ABC transporter periplasmic protein LptC [Rubrivivax sp.]
MNKRWLVVLDQAQSAVPMVLLAGLAAFTWWLVQSAPKPEGATPAAQASSSPDYELQNARVERYSPQGQLIAVLDGQAMRHFTDGDRLEIDAVQLSARDPKGQHLQAVARQGEASGDTDTVVLHGGAHVVATPASGTAVGGRRVDQSPMVFDGEVLRVNTRDRLVTSELPVKITHAQGQLQGGNLRHEESTGITLLGNRVHGRYNAASRP